MSEHFRTKPVNPGGLIRCCHLTMDTVLVHETEGETLECVFCDSVMIFQNGVWRWLCPNEPG